MTPYEVAAEIYVRGGWSPIPMTGAIEGTAKGVPMGGVTGGQGSIQDAEAVTAFLARPDRERWPNISVRLFGVVGFDVDTYDGRNGLATLAAAEAALGALPPTCFSTARDPSTGSGIRFYRLPGDIDDRSIQHESKSFGRYGKNIEVIRFGHRYAKVWPTPHPTGALYRWYLPNGKLVPEGQVPKANQLPTLPPAWVDFITNGAPPTIAGELGGTEASQGSTTRVHTREEALEYLQPFFAAVMAEPWGVDASFNDRLNAAAFNVANFVPGVFTPDEAWEMVADLIRHHGAEPDKADAATIQSGFGSTNRSWSSRLPTDDDRSDAFGHHYDMARAHLGGAAPRPRNRTPKTGPLPAQEVTEDVVRGMFATLNRLPETFYQTEQLRHLYQTARAGCISPEAVLMSHLAEVITATPHFVVLPGELGSDVVASLNTFFLLIGPSGAGKNKSRDAARTAVKVDHNDCKDGTAHKYDRGRVHTAKPATSQGLNAIFRNRTTDKEHVLYVVRKGAWLTVGEVSSFDAITTGTNDPSGELCEAWTGAALDAQTKDRERYLPLAAHGYRLCMSIGMQPGIAAGILEKEVMGLPQRMVWIPSMPLPEDNFELDEITWKAHEDKWPKPKAALDWRLPKSMPNADPMRSVCYDHAPLPDFALVVMPTARSVMLEAKAINHRIAAGDRDPLDAHAGLIRLKLAAGFALMHGRWDIDPWDWHKAGELMILSNDTRSKVIEVQRMMSVKKAQDAAASRGRATVIEREAAAWATSRTVLGFADMIMSHVTAAGPDGISPKTIWKKLHRHDVALLKRALAELETEGLVRIEETGTHRGQPVFKVYSA